MKSFLFSGLLLLIMFGCKSGQKPNNMASLSMRKVASGNLCGISEPREVVIADAAAWAALWQEVGSRQQPAPPLPAVDFTKETVIACFLGAKPTGGYGIGIETVSPTAMGCQVAVTHVSPGKKCVVTEAFTYPYQIVAVAGMAGRAATFSVSPQSKDCP